MKKDDLRQIEDTIGYIFKNANLLQQAFVRKSYSQDKGVENNEILEFLGDKALDVTIVKILDKKFGGITDGKFKEYYCERDEGELTEIKKRLVCKQSLSKAIHNLKLANYLLVGGFDKDYMESDSIKEDLFEAIIGAVAIDSKWNFDEIRQVVEMMLNPVEKIENSFIDIQDDYVANIQKWSLKNYNELPTFTYEEANCNNTNLEFAFNKEVLCLEDDYYNPSYDNYICFLELQGIDKTFSGLGISKCEAREKACQVAYLYLKDNNLLYDITDKIKNPNRGEAINQLEILARRGYFSIPTYKFLEEYDSNGNPGWKAECQIEEENNVFWATSSFKKKLKKNVLGKC